jgi:hypothetical protein
VTVVPDMDWIRGFGDLGSGSGSKKKVKVLKGWIFSLEVKVTPGAWKSLLKLGQKYVKFFFS